METDIVDGLLSGEMTILPNHLVLRMLARAEAHLEKNKEKTFEFKLREYKI